MRTERPALCLLEFTKRCESGCALRPISEGLVLATSERDGTNLNKAVVDIVLADLTGPGKPSISRVMRTELLRKEGLLEGCARYPGADINQQIKKN